MAKRTIRQTMESLPDAPTGAPSASASYRRECAAREIERKHGRVLDAIAKIAFADATESALRLKALQALASYIYPQLKAVEVSGPDGGTLTIEVRKAAPTGTPTGGEGSGGAPA